MSSPRSRNPGTASLGVLESERDLLDLYLREVSRSPLLAPAEELAVARRARLGDAGARDELVARNLRFVISIAKRYQHRGLSLADLIGEGNLGLLIAARKFDPEIGVKFISYAVWWIRQSILAALARQGRPVRVPLNRTADLVRIVRTAELLRQELDREPQPFEIGERLGLSTELVESLLALNSAELRLDGPTPGLRDSTGDAAALERFIAEGSGDTETEVMQRLLVEEVRRALRTLVPRDARVLRLYFGLDGGREHTLEEIGALFGVTRERVRQLRDRALRRLREGSARRALESFAA